jgi:hypothetical protein
MTEPLRKSIESLRALAPKLNAATDDAARVVQMVERFLAEDCRLTLTAWVPLAGDGDASVEKSLGYTRLANRFRIVLRQNPSNGLEHGRADSGQAYAWTDAPRGERLNSFRQLPELLDHIAELAQSCIKSAAETSSAVSKILDGGSGPLPVAPAVPAPAPSAGHRSGGRQNSSRPQAQVQSQVQHAPPLCREYPDEGVKRPVKVI